MLFLTLDFTEKADNINLYGILLSAYFAKRVRRMKKVIGLFALWLLCLAFAVPSFADHSEISLKRPSEMKAVFLQPTIEFDPRQSESVCKEQIVSALNQAADFGMNTVFISANYEQGSIFDSSLWENVSSFDALEYAISEARARNLYVYVIVDAAQAKSEGGVTNSGVSAEFIQKISAEISHLAQQYAMDGLYLTGYYNSQNSGSMHRYRAEGASMGFENWMRECTTSLIVNASCSLKTLHPEMVFGIIADPVWANASTEPTGSDSSADFEMLTDGYVDLNAIGVWAELDDILIKAPGSLTDDALHFRTIIEWWAQRAEQMKASVSALVYNHKLGGDARGWKAPDQVMRQIICTREVSNCKGAAFASLAALKENYSGSTDVLMRYYENKIAEQDILTDLTVSKPEKRTYTTQEPQAIFYGASDPNFPLKINGEELDRNGEGVFSAEIELKPGLNTFVFEHKEKSITYKITREVVIINGVSPAGSITVGGGTEIGISVMAYSGSSVTASLAGSTVTLTEQELTDDSADGNTSSYVPFKGSIVVPAGSENEQDIGKISVSSTWDGITQSAAGAHVFVAAIPKQAPQVEGEKGNLVQVVAGQARTYPGGILTNDPYGNCFPLPAGTVDFIVSDKLTYDDDYGHGEYFVLGSGVRVRAEDVTSLGEAEWELSSVTNASSWADEQYIYIGLSRSGRKTAFSVDFPGVAYTSNGGAKGFGASQMRVTLKDTQLNTAAPELAANNLLNGVELISSGNDTVIHFNLSKPGSFLGYRAYYDGDMLVFRFNQIPSSISGAKIYIDPGHGGMDSGASIPGMYTERDINADLAGRTAQILRDRGAIVQLTETSGSVSLNRRIELSQGFGPHLFVSIHFNSGVSSARGTEAYYFNPYSKSFAANVSSRIANALDTRNRGDKYGAYRVTTHMEFPAILMEGGFLTNPDELSKIQNNDYKNAMAVALADAIQGTLESMR